VATSSRGRSPAGRLRFALAFVLVVAPAAFAGSAPSQAVESVAARARTATPPVAGTWHRLPPAPIAPSSMVSVWTGRQMLMMAGHLAWNP